MKKETQVQLVERWARQENTWPVGYMLQAIRDDHPELRQGQIFFGAMSLAERTVLLTPSDGRIVPPIIKDTFHLSDKEFYNILLEYAKFLESGSTKP